MQLSPYHRAMDEGRAANRAGISLDSNPYHPYWPSLAGAWRVGWEDADDHEIPTTGSVPH